MLDIEGIIFDLDGTLIDSAKGHLRLVEEICRRLEIPLLSKEVIPDFVLAPLDNIRMLFPPNLHDGNEDLLNEAKRVMMEVYQDIGQQDKEMFDGVDILLKNLHRKRIKIAIVTSTHKRFLDRKIQPLIDSGVDQLIEAIICIEDAPRKKPAPDPLLECLKRIQLMASKSVYVGDSCIDIRAGKAAGMKTIGVLTGLDDHKRLSEEGPDLIIDNVIDLTSTPVLQKH